MADLTWRTGFKTYYTVKEKAQEHCPGRERGPVCLRHGWTWHQTAIILHILRLNDDWDSYRGAYRTDFPAISGVTMDWCHPGRQLNVSPLFSPKKTGDLFQVIATTWWVMTCFFRHREFFSFGSHPWTPNGQSNNVWKRIFNQICTRKSASNFVADPENLTIRVEKS